MPIGIEYNEKPPGPSNSHRIQHGGGDVISMATCHKEIRTSACADDVWDAIREVGALHTRLVPGFVVDTKVEGDARVVTFGNGLVVREPIVTINEEAKRLVWSSVSDRLTHYNASVQVSNDGTDGGTRVVWIADFLPNEAAPTIDGMMSAGMQVMKTTLDRLTTPA